jgi:CDP-paratose 2-epimerase
MLDYHRIYGLNTVVFRHSSIYGGRQFANYDQGWIGWFCQKAIETRNDPDTNFSISGTGKQVRDVLYATDLVDAYFAVLENIASVAGHVFNLGGGVENSLSLLELFSLLEEKLNVKMNYQKLPFRKSDQKVFVADNSKAKRLINWVPFIDKNIGLDLMLKWCQNILDGNPNAK